MNKYKYLNIKETNLEDNQLYDYLKHSAEEHIIIKNSNKKTYPIKSNDIHWDKEISINNKAKM